MSYYIINRECCIGHVDNCNLDCVEVCPPEAIRLAASGEYYVSISDCIECGMCQDKCIFGCISELDC